MFVKTLCHKIINLSNCDEIRLDLSVQDNDGEFDKLFAIFGEREILLISFHVSIEGATENVFNSLFGALCDGEKTFDIEDTI